MTKPADTRDPPDDSLQRRLHEVCAELLRTHSEHIDDMNALSCEIAHELKNPLACVKGMAELMALEQDPARFGERLSVLRGQLERTLRILDEFLQLSRPLLPLSQERIDLRELYAAVAELFVGQASERGVSLIVDRQQGPAIQDEPLLVRCDPRRIRQVLIALLQNALLLSPPHSRLRVELSRRGEQAVLVLRDERPVGASVCPGLNLARGVLEQHHGSLTIIPGHSEPGGAVSAAGCTTVVQLPIDGVPLP